MKKHLLLILSLFIYLNSFCINPGYFGKHVLINLDNRISHAFLVFTPGLPMPYYETRAKLEFVVDSKISMVSHYGFQYNYNFLDELKIAGDNLSSTATNYSHNLLFGFKYFGNNIAPIGKYHQFGVIVSFENSSSGNPQVTLNHPNATSYLSFNYIYGRTFRLNNSLMLDWGVEVNINEKLFSGSSSAGKIPGLGNPLYQLFSFHIGLTGALF